MLPKYAAFLYTPKATKKHKLAKAVNKTFIVSTLTPSRTNRTKTGLNPNIKLAETANNTPLRLPLTTFTIQQLHIHVLP
jgi:hypothetical protein